MNNQPHTHLFTQADRTKDPDFFVRFMDEAQSRMLTGEAR
jgi:hypothetical protein